MQEPVQELVLRRGFTEQGYPVPAALTVGTCARQGSKKQPCTLYRGIINAVFHQGAASTGSSSSIRDAVAISSCVCFVCDPTQLPLLDEEAGSSLENNSHVM